MNTSRNCRELLSKKRYIKGQYTENNKRKKKEDKDKRTNKR